MLKTPISAFAMAMLSTTAIAQTLPNTKLSGVIVQKACLTGCVLPGVDTKAEADAQTGISTANKALGNGATNTAQIGTLTGQVTSLQQSISTLSSQLSAFKASIKLNQTSNTVTFTAAGGYAGVANLTSVGGTSTGGSYTALSDGITNAVLQIDPAEPNSTATCTTGTACIQIDGATSRNVLGITDTVANQVTTHGYGELSLQLDTGLNLPFFHGGNDSVNNAYDGVVYTAATGAPMVNPIGNAEGCLIEAVQRGNQATAFSSFWGSQNLDWTGTTDPNGDTFAGMGSATYVETSATPYGTPTVIAEFSPDGIHQCISRGESVSCGGTGTIGGIGGMTRTELLNNPQADVYFEKCWAGYPGDSVMQSAIAIHEARLHITGDTGTFTSVSPGAKAPLAIDNTQSFLTTPNFPVSDKPPVPATGTTPTLPGGITLASGATYKAYYDFTPAGNVNNRRLLNQYFYYQSMFGNQENPLGNDGIQGDTGSNWSQVRTYAATNQYNLLNFTSAGLNTGVICSQNNTLAGCTQGNIYGTMLRPTVTIPTGGGYIIHYRIQGGPSAVWYQAVALYSGVEMTPGPNDFVDYPKVTFDPNCYGEDDLWDGYWITNSYAIGRSLKMGVEPIYSYAKNANNQCFTKAPSVVYGANGPNFFYTANTPYTPYSALQSGNTYSGMHDIVEWMEPGNSMRDYYFDGKLVIREFYQDSPTSPGWFLTMNSQTKANFNPELSQAVDCYTQLINGPCSATYAMLEVIQGNIASVSSTQDTNGANSDPINGLSGMQQSQNITTTPAATTDQATRLTNLSATWPQPMPAMPSYPVAATSGTPRIEQVRNKAVIATYTTFNDQPGCSQVADSNGLYYVTPAASAASGCGPFTRTHAFRLWAPGDLFNIYPAVYSGPYNNPWIGPEFTNGANYNNGNGTPVNPDNITLQGIVQNNTRPVLALNTGASDNTLNQAVLYFDLSSGVTVNDIDVIGTAGEVVGKAGIGNYGASNLTFNRMEVSGFDIDHMCIFSASAAPFSGFWNMNEMNVHDCGGGQGLSHNFYIGASGVDPNYTVTLTHSWSHDVRFGHLFKSRAQRTVLIGNFLQGNLPVTGQSQSEDYDIDDPNGGFLDVEGNLLTHTASGPSTNGNFIAYNFEGTTNTTGDAGPRNFTSIIKNNTFFSAASTFDGSHRLYPILYSYPTINPTDPGWNAQGYTATVQNNVFIGFPAQSYFGDNAVVAGISEINSSMQMTGNAHVFSSDAAIPSFADFLSNPALRTSSTIGARD